MSFLKRAAYKWKSEIWRTAAVFLLFLLLSALLLAAEAGGNMALRMESTPDMEIRIVGFAALLFFTVTAVILVLFYCYPVQKRDCEIGILLTLGENPIKILVQYAVELMLPMSLACMAAAAAVRLKGAAVCAVLLSGQWEVWRAEMGIGAEDVIWTLGIDTLAVVIVILFLTGRIAWYGTRKQTGNGKRQKVE